MKTQNGQTMIEVATAPYPDPRLQGDRINAAVSAWESNKSRREPDDWVMCPDQVQRRRTQLKWLTVL